jgi:MFS transporter, SP family, general alpha glucoside:H+ symporter
MFNSDEGNLGGRIRWILAATAVVAVVIIFFEFPETKDRTYAELERDEMFEDKAPTRKFKTYSPRRYVA